MSVLTLIPRLILGFFSGITKFFNKMMCFLHIKRGRKNSGTLLPMHSDTIKNEVQTSLPSNDQVDEFTSWDNWGEIMGIPSPMQPPNNQAAMPGYMNTHSNNLQRNWVQGQPEEEDEEEEPEPDYFSDMQPDIRRSAKIMVRKKETVNNARLTSRFVVNTNLPPPTDGELGDMDEQSETTWGDEALEDLSWEANSAIKEKKRLERDHRKLEQMRKKQERDAAKFRKDSGGGLVASKLS